MPTSSQAHRQRGWCRGHPPGEPATWSGDEAAEGPEKRSRALRGVFDWQSDVCLAEVKLYEAHEMSIQQSRRDARGPAVL